MKDADKSHHVAWADRIGYNKLLFQDIQACSVAFGTEAYSNSVWRLYYDIVNIKNGPALKDKIDEYLNNEWYPKRDEMIRKSDAVATGDMSVINEERDNIVRQMMPGFCFYMKQLLETNGFGFYESEITSDDGGLDQ